MIFALLPVLGLTKCERSSPKLTARVEKLVSGICALEFFESEEACKAFNLDNRALIDLVGILSSALGSKRKTKCTYCRVDVFAHEVGYIDLETTL